MATKTMRRVSLFYRDDRSDKVYSVGIHPAGTGFEVIAEYGRRGGTMQTDKKTAGPVLLETAQALFDKLVREKTAKGYREGGSAPIVQIPEVSAGAREGQGSFRDLPSHMLLNPIEEPMMRKLLTDDAWLLQPKFDGIRIRLEKSGQGKGATQTSTVRAFSRTQKPVALPDAVVAAAAHLTRDFVVDGELIGETFVAFDVLVDGALHLWREACEFRAGFVTTMFKRSAAIVPTVTALTSPDKQALYDSIRRQGMEGLVFKLKQAPYSSGRPHTNGPALKYKFLNTASVIVRGRHGSKNSIDVMLYDGRDLGSVTMIGKTIPPPGTVVELEYLYVHDVGGKLIQPVFLRVRDDVDPADCTADQLRVKGKER